MHDNNRPTRTWILALWAVLALVAFIGFLSLGNWQVERRAWKRDLIARVQQRVHAPAVAAPARAEWPNLSIADDEYRNIRLAGEYLHDRTALVQATTVLGQGFWVITPLRTADGGTILVNRGFVPQGRTQGAWRTHPSPLGQTHVNGLLRLTEPDGGFLRSNDPQADRWHSRDVAAIARSRNLEDAAPYFVDAWPLPGTPPALSPEQLLEPTRIQLDDEALPVPGLTVVSFNNNHLTYLLTWYGLALMVALAAGFVWRVECRVRRRIGEATDRHS